MGILVVSMVASILYALDVITTEVYLCVVFGYAAWSFIAAGLYFAFGFLKIFYHDLAGWHRPDDSPKRFDGITTHATCKYCGKDIMQDSQGNWFC